MNTKHYSIKSLCTIGLILCSCIFGQVKAQKKGWNDIFVRPDSISGLSDFTENPEQVPDNVVALQRQVHFNRQSGSLHSENINNRMSHAEREFSLETNLQQQSQCSGIYISAPSSLVPNFNFEERDCCPNDVTDTGQQMDCIEDHQQASEATIDYHVTGCGRSLGHPEIPHVPSGTPSNNGMLGMVNATGWKEYLGTCLLGNLEVGKSYTLTFKVGFGKFKVIETQAYTPFIIAIFGTSNCGSLPFSGTSCPVSSSPNWAQLGTSQLLSGNDEWVEGTITFTVPYEMGAIAIGPDCSPTGGLTGYYYLDDLILNETNLFSPTISIAPSGNPCADFQLVADDYPSEFTYQWYYNGNLIPGAIQRIFQVPEGQEGTYIVRLYHGGQCVESSPYLFELPYSEVWVEEEACYGESVNIGQESFDASGEYSRTLVRSDGCDSIVHLSLFIRDDIIVSHEQESEILCAGGTVPVNLFSNRPDPVFTWDDGKLANSRQLGAGVYEVFATDDFGCQSTPYSFFISEPDSLQISLSLMHETCVGRNDGIAQPFIWGGITPYRIKLDGATFFEPYFEDMEYNGLSPDEYTFLVVDSNNCMLSGQFRIQPREPVEVHISHISPVPIGDSVKLSVETYPEIDLEFYNWQGNALDCPSCPEPTITPMTPPFNQYYVSVIEREVGCVYTAGLRIEVKDGIYIPNVFSPDEDGWNDRFLIYSYPGSVVQIEAFQIFDRWGEVLFARNTFQPNEEQQGWDGTFRGMKMPPATYIYIASIDLVNGDKVVKKGTVTLLR